MNEFGKLLNVAWNIDNNDFVFCDLKDIVHGNLINNVANFVPLKIYRVAQVKRHFSAFIHTYAYERVL